RGNCPEPADPLGQQWTTQQRADESVLGLLETRYRLPAESQEWPDAVIDLRTGRHQLAEVTYFVEALLVMGHSGFHQQPRNAILHLHHLVDQQLSVPQSAAAVPDLGLCHMTLRQEVAAEAVG